MGTVWRVIVLPGPSFRGARDEGSGYFDLVFAGICCGVGFVGQSVALEALASTGWSAGVHSVGASVALGRTICLLIPFVFWWLIIEPSIEYWILRLLGAKPKGWQTQLRASALATAPLVLGIIPFGLVLGLVWSFGVKAWAYRVFHSASWAAAALAVLVTPALVALAVYAAW